MSTSDKNSSRQFIVTERDSTDVQRMERFFYGIQITISLSQGLLLSLIDVQTNSSGGSRQLDKKEGLNETHGFVVCVYYH